MQPNAVSLWPQNIYANDQEEKKKTGEINDNKRATIIFFQFKSHTSLLSCREQLVVHSNM